MNQAAVKLLVQIVVSLSVLAAGFYVILSGAYDETYAKWAFGMIGLIVGYWLR